MGKDKDGSQVLHLQAGKADDLDLSNLFPDAQVVSDFFIYRMESAVKYKFSLFLGTVGFLGLSSG